MNLRKGVNVKLTIRNAVLLLPLALCVGAGAVVPDEIRSMMTNMARNAQELKQYTYKQRIETYYKEELKSSRIDEIHYEVNGERVSIPLAQQKVEEKQRPVRGPMSRFVAKRVEAKQGEMKEYVERLLALSSRYMSSDAERIKSAMNDADLTVSGGAKGYVRIRFRDFVKNGDMVTMSFDPQTKRPVRTEVETRLDDDPVMITMMFDQLRNGPYYAGRTVVRSESQSLEIRAYLYEQKL